VTFAYRWRVAHADNRLERECAEESEAKMLLVQDVFQVKWGRGDEMVATLKELQSTLGEVGFGEQHRIMTDGSGRMFTVIEEYVVGSFSEWEQDFEKLMGVPELQDFMAKTADLVDSAERRFYNVVE